MQGDSVVGFSVARRDRSQLQFRVQVYGPIVQASRLAIMFLGSVFFCLGEGGCLGFRVLGFRI